MRMESGPEGEVVRQIINEIIPRKLQSDLDKCVCVCVCVCMCMCTCAPVSALLYHMQPLFHESLFILQIIIRQI